MQQLFLKMLSNVIHNKLKLFNGRKGKKTKEIFTQYFMTHVKW